MTPAERLRAARIAANLTQAAAAERIGATRSYWCQLESGHRIPTEGQLLRIAHRLGWRPEELDPTLAKPKRRTTKKNKESE